MILHLVLTLCLSSVQGAASEPAQDPWAPGQTRDPWPLIGSLQRFEAASSSEPRWDLAIHHDEPLVRAAAAAAFGRVPEPRWQVALAGLLDDRVAIVRRTAQWASLQQIGEPTRDLASRIVAGSAGDPEAMALLGPWLPAEFPHMNPAERRRWIAEQPPGPLRQRGGMLHPGPERVRVAVSRSEFDSDEIVKLRVRLEAGPAAGVRAWPLGATLLPHDPWRPTELREDDRREADRSQHITVRVVGGAPGGTTAIKPDKNDELMLAFDLGEVPPDVYTLKLGNPIFLRVRRSPALEMRGMAAIQAGLLIDADMATAERLRMGAAAPVLKRRFAKNLARYGYGYNAWRDTVALAWLADPTAADLVLPPLLAAKGFFDPYRLEAPDLVWFFTRGFGGAARSRIAMFVGEWSAALVAGHDESLARIVSDRGYAKGSPVDDARLDILAKFDLGATLSPSSETHRMNSLAAAAMMGAALDHPSEVGGVLARKEGHSEALVRSLQRLANTLPAAQVERLIHAIWSALAGPRPVSDDARAAVSFEAKKHGVSLPESPSLAPLTASEVERRLHEAAGYDGLGIDVEGALSSARELLSREPAPLVSLLAAEIEMQRGRPEAAERLVPGPTTFPEKPGGLGDRRRAHAVLGRAAAARGDLVIAARELTAAGDVRAFAGGASVAAEINGRIAELGLEAQGHVQFWPVQLESDAWRGEPLGSRLFWISTAGELRAFDTQTRASFVFGGTPVPIRGFRPVGPETVIAWASGHVWRLDLGRGVTWARATQGEIRVEANETVTLVKHGNDKVEAWATTEPATDLWQLEGGPDVPLIAGQGGGILAFHPGVGPDCQATARCWLLRLLDESTGRARWSTVLPVAPVLWKASAGIAVLWSPDDKMSAYDMKSGRRLWVRDFQTPRRWLYGNHNAEFVVAADSQRIYLRIDANLHALSIEDGRTLWTLPFVRNAGEFVDSISDQRLVAIPRGAVWWLGSLSKPSRSGVARLVDGDGIVRFALPPTDNSTIPLVLPDGTLLVPARFGRYLEVWDAKSLLGRTAPWPHGGAPLTAVRRGFGACAAKEQSCPLDAVSVAMRDGTK